MSFATGETVEIVSVARRDVDSDVAVSLDVVVTGDVPYISPQHRLELHPYAGGHRAWGKGAAGADFRGPDFYGA